MRYLCIAIVLSLSFWGCFEFDILIKVNRDGSGTIEQTVLMNKAAVQQMQELAQSFGETKKNKFSLIDKKKLIKDAAKMGAGVYFLSVKPISEKEREGYIAYYSFNDINTLKINQNPSEKVPLPGDGESKAPEEPFTFSFQKGKLSTLSLRQPEKTFTPDSTSDTPQESSAAAEDTSGFEMMAEMMKGFRMSLALQINGTILKTNATYVDANRITLMEMDFEQLIRDRNKFYAISKQKPKTIEEAKQALKDIPGIKFDMADEITIQF
jgi:hypothetical protein